VWERQTDGLTLTFRLAGINNQNFLMRDEETGSYWQQISGRAIAGPLTGRQLSLAPSDELTFGLWKSEQPGGEVLQESAAHVAFYAKKDWEARMQKTPVVLSYSQGAMKPRTLIFGVSAFGAAKAYSEEIVLREKLVLDRLKGVPLLLVTGPDGRSVRAFRATLGGRELELYRLTGDDAAVMMDGATGSRWNFQGCAISGKSAPLCLERVELIKDYWFDWRHYHPETQVFSAQPSPRKQPAPTRVDR
jgi:hypothetical protein